MSPTRARPLSAVPALAHQYDSPTTYQSDAAHTKQCLPAWSYANHGMHAQHTQSSTEGVPYHAQTLATLTSSIRVSTGSLMVAQVITSCRSGRTRAEMFAVYVSHPAPTILSKPSRTRNVTRLRLRAAIAQRTHAHLRTLKCPLSCDLWRAWAPYSTTHTGDVRVMSHTHPYALTAVHTRVLVRVRACVCVCHTYLLTTPDLEAAGVLLSGPA